MRKRSICFECYHILLDKSNCYYLEFQTIKTIVICDRCISTYQRTQYRLYDNIRAQNVNIALLTKKSSRLRISSYYGEI
jgi:hypothetical protein